MKRREFVSLMGASSLAPLAIASCNSKTPQQKVTISPPRSDGFQSVGTLSDLKTKGQILVEEKSFGKALIIPDTTGNNGAIAVNPTCPHASCAVAWQQDQNAFICPCHESKFDRAGKVLQGPADKPLVAYTTKIEGDTVLIKAV